MSSDKKDVDILGKSKRLILGIHVNKDIISPKETITSHIISAIKEAKDYGIELRAIQIFIANPRTGKPTIETDSAQYKELKLYTEHHPEIFFVIHSPYTTTSLWNLDSKSHNYAAYTMRDELRVSNDAGFRGVIIHLSSEPLIDVIKNLPAIIPKTRSYIYLESAHVKPNKSHFESPEKLAKLFIQIREKVDPKLTYFGFCLDTAHLWATGVNISSAKDAAKWIEGLKSIHKILPPENIMIHLNGSKHECGDGIDAHAELMSNDDKIWGKLSYKDSGLAQFIAYAKEFNIPCILERRHGYMYSSDFKLLLEHEPSVAIQSTSVIK
jgi:endonuclease IV